MLNNIPPAALFTATWTRGVLPIFLRCSQMAPAFHSQCQLFGLNLQTKSSIAFWYSVPMVRHYRILPILYHPVCFEFIAGYPIIRLFFFAKCYQCLFAYRIIIVVRGLFYPVAYISKSVSIFTDFSVKCQLFRFSIFTMMGLIVNSSSVGLPW